MGVCASKSPQNAVPATAAVVWDDEEKGAALARYLAGDTSEDELRVALTGALNDVNPALVQQEIDAVAEARSLLEKAIHGFVNRFINGESDGSELVAGIIAAGGSEARAAQMQAKFTSARGATATDHLVLAYSTGVTTTKEEFSAALASSVATAPQQAEALARGETARGALNAACDAAVAAFVAGTIDAAALRAAIDAAGAAAPFAERIAEEAEETKEVASDIVDAFVAAADPASTTVDIAALVKELAEEGVAAAAAAAIAQVATQRCAARRDAIGAVYEQYYSGEIASEDALREALRSKLGFADAFTTAALLDTVVQRAVGERTVRVGITALIADVAHGRLAPDELRASLAALGVEIDPARVDATVAAADEATATLRSAVEAATVAFATEATDEAGFRATLAELGFAAGNAADESAVLAFVAAATTARADVGAKKESALLSFVDGNTDATELATELAALGFDRSQADAARDGVSAARDAKAGEVSAAIERFVDGEIDEPTLRESLAGLGMSEARIDGALDEVRTQQAARVQAKADAREAAKVDAIKQFALGKMDKEALIAILKSLAFDHDAVKSLLDAANKLKQVKLDQLCDQFVDSGISQKKFQKKINVRSLIHGYASRVRMH